jgi:hypothetical protein
MGDALRDPEVLVTTRWPGRRSDWRNAKPSACPPRRVAAEQDRAENGGLLFQTTHRWAGEESSAMRGPS